MILLDLDTSYFTKPKDLESIYGTLWGRLDIRIGVVPFHRGMGAYVSKDAEPNRRYSVAENRELVAYLKEKQRARHVTLFQHGFDHTPREFARPRGVRDRLRRGRAHLEETFGVRMTMFLPPNGALCIEAMQALQAERIDVVGRFSYDPRKRERAFGPDSLWQWARTRLYYRRHPDETFPHAIRCGPIREWDIAWLVPGHAPPPMRGLIGTHYWELRDDPQRAEEISARAARSARPSAL